MLAAHRRAADAAGIEWKSAVYRKVGEEVMASGGLTIRRMLELGRVSRPSFYRFDPQHKPGADRDMELRDAIQGGDWGAGVTTALGHLVPPGLAGIHLNWQFVLSTEMPEHLSFEEQRAVDGAKRFLGDGNGYFRQQATGPQTIGYALSDSPAGQAMWIYEKFYSWTDNNGSRRSRHYYYRPNRF